MQFLSPKVQFSLLTVWKFQFFFVSLQRKRKGIFLSFNAAAQRFKGLRPFKAAELRSKGLRVLSPLRYESGKAERKRVPNLIQARRMSGSDVFASKMTGQDAESARASLRIAPAG